MYNYSKIKDIIENEQPLAIEIYGDSIIFELSGDKGIGYSFMEKIKEIFKGKKAEIRCMEYVETQEGYYYNSEDEEEEV